ncbi:AAEL007645-PA [Aedes aegypti]|uniref:AAEL007645-PA n=1 Tax=Aedes aegypti TaxID=7159 RepID=Q171G9_AEDAE|nr:AAEL007645-PA [Aedes aegypti]
MTEEDNTKHVVAGPSGSVKIAMNFGSFDNYVAGDDFEVYEKRMLQHFLLHDIPEGRKVAFLLTHLGMDTYAILKKLLQPVNPSTKTYAELVAALKKHFRPDVNKCYLLDILWINNNSCLRLF